MEEKETEGPAGAEVLGSGGGFGLVSIPITIRPQKANKVTAESTQSNICLDTME